MKLRSILFFGLLLTLIANIVVAPSPIWQCSDTDDGLNWAVVGTVDGEREGASFQGLHANIADSCVSTSAGLRLREGYCQTNGFVGLTDHDCGTGLTCINGACVTPTPTPSPTPTPAPTCIDTDGNNPVVQSNVFSVQNGQTRVYNDICKNFDINSLLEYTCTDSGVNGLTTNCKNLFGPNGRCWEGVCINSQAAFSCTKLGGLDPNTQQTVTITDSRGTFTFTDSCIGNQVIEYGCSQPTYGQNKYATANRYDCANQFEGGICLDGRCTTPTPTPSPSPTPTTTPCTDSDGGVNTDVRGTVSTATEPGIQDECIQGFSVEQSTTVLEYSCDGSDYKYDLILCGNGMICSDGTCILEPTCTDGTLTGACSTNKPKYCNTQLQLVDSASTCGCPTGLIASGDTCVTPTCTDGTSTETCSATKPKYCNTDLTLTDKATQCGCPQGKVASGDACVTPTCTDGTLTGACSTNKPKYCNPNLQLIDQATTCGCPQGKVVRGDACVTPVTMSKTPTACSGSWSSCSRAFSTDSLVTSATATSTTNPITGTWRSFNFAIPTGAQITNAKIVLKVKATSTNAKLAVRVRKNGATSYLPTQNVIGLSTSSIQTKVVELPITGLEPSDFAGTGATGFQVEIGGLRLSSSNNPVIYIDEIRTQVTYLPLVPVTSTTGSTPEDKGNIFERILDAILRRLFGA